MSQRSTTGLDRADCLALLATQSFGRLIFTRRALPDVLPVAYRLDGENVLIRLTSGSAAASASHNAVVAFEIDSFDTLARTGWTVTLVGRAHELTDPDERLQLATRDLSSWTDGERNHVLSVAAEKISGHRFSDLTRRSELRVQSLDVSLSGPEEEPPKLGSGPNSTRRELLD